MSLWYTVFLFAFSLNLFVYFIAGLRDIFFRRPGSTSIRTWLIHGLMIAFWGLIALGISRVISGIPGGSALFIVFFVLAFLLVRGGLILLASRTRPELWERYGWRVDEVIKHPVQLIPVLIVGYHEFSLPTALLVLLSAWIGYGTALGLFRLIQKRIELENAEHRLRGPGVLFLSMALLAMLIGGIFRSFFPQLVW
jgi:succinate dehydrogenase/fumarate reductase cytochrome b subunit